MEIYDDFFCFQCFIAPASEKSRIRGTEFLNEARMKPALRFWCSHNHSYTGRSLVKDK